MSFKDPLIKELKGYILQLTEELKKKPEIDDSSNNIMSLCTTLEKIFQKGCTLHSWNVLHEIGHSMELGKIVPKSLNYVRSVEMVETCQKVKTPLGKLRLLIRSCLVSQCLHVPVEVMVRSYNNLMWSWYELETSILGNQILGEIFLSVLLQCSSMHFNLDIDNSRFLDITLDLPYNKFIEFVPSDALGVAISFIDDIALVVQVDKKSVAAEDDKIEVGDVLDELNGRVLHSRLRGKLNYIMVKGKKKPIHVRIIKLRNPENGCIFPAIQMVLRKAHIDILENDGSQCNKSNEKENKIVSKNNRDETEVNYVGAIDIGPSGHVKMIEVAISCLIKNCRNSEPVKVIFECHELGLNVIKKLTGEVLMKNSYMEISSCAQTNEYPEYFGYIAGNDLCNLASKFICYVFHTESDFDIKRIMQNISEGFRRTHFAV